MADKMLIDATHPEETRVVVLRGNRVEEFDFESANRKQLRGNIYLAKVTRVEPSLQAAFVDYGGNRHGFLAFSEIHPDYYQIPVADRQALIAQEERDQRAADADADNAPAGAAAVIAIAARAAVATATSCRASRSPARRQPRPRRRGEAAAGQTTAFGRDLLREQPSTEAPRVAAPPKPKRRRPSSRCRGEHVHETALTVEAAEELQRTACRRGRRAKRRCETDRARASSHPAAAEGALTDEGAARHGRRPTATARNTHEEEAVESVGGADALEEVQERAAALPPPVQDSGSHQAPAGDAGAGRQGRARHQGRGADHLSLARRPLFGADAEHRARRRHFAQDHHRPKTAAA